jgi:hypothetical protein
METSESGNVIRHRPGHCPTHGAVDATKEVPKFRFPFLLYGGLRVLSSFQPYRCPQCGEKVSSN